MKPEFAKHLSADLIIHIEGDTKKQALDEIIDFAATKCTLDEDQLREAIWKREKMMTTGVGQGLALPHIRVPGFPQPLVIIGICKKPIADYKSLDNEPIKLVVFIAADENDQEAYLKLLGSVSYKLKDSKMVESILEVAKNKKKVHALLTKD
jgi:PTS system nitrogen regulatory IIA component